MNVRKISLPLVEIDKIPIGDGNGEIVRPLTDFDIVEINKIPIGDGNFTMFSLFCENIIVEINKIPIGDGNCSDALAISESTSLDETDTPKRGRKGVIMSFVYITEDGAVLSLNGGYFEVTHKDGLLEKIPKETLESVSLFGNVSITTPCVKELLVRGIPVSYFSKKGAYYGKLISTRHTNIFRLKNQIYESDNDTFSLSMAKQIIYAKINNQLVVARRYCNNPTESQAELIKNIKYYKDKIDYVNDSTELMGYEGITAKLYFSLMSELVDTGFQFNGRSKQPPKDPFNSLLSLGYTLLMNELYGEIENKGMTAYCGFIHKGRERHPTLASDLMEEWRAVIVDSVALSLIQGHEIHTNDFVTDEETGGVYLNKDGMKLFLQKYENKMRTYCKYINGAEMSFRKCLWHQVNVLTHAIEENRADLYKPIIIR